MISADLWRQLKPGLQRFLQQALTRTMTPKFGTETVTHVPQLRITLPARVVQSCISTASRRLFHSANVPITIRR